MGKGEKRNEKQNKKGYSSIKGDGVERGYYRKNIYRRGSVDESF
jgi:hypothetical protein